MSVKSQWMKFLLCEFPSFLSFTKSLQKHSTDYFLKKKLYNVTFTRFYLYRFICLIYSSSVFTSYMLVCCMLAVLKDPSNQLKPVKDSCVYLWGWGPCPPHRKVRSSGLFPAIWCQNCTHHPSGSLEEDGGRIWAAREPSKASLETQEQPDMLIKHLKYNGSWCFWWLKRFSAVSR